MRQALSDGIDGGPAAGVALSSACVCVPARDEAARLPRLFAALAAQRGAGAWSLHLLLDSCCDDSEAVAARLVAQAPFAVAVDRLAPAPPSAGRARGAALGMGVRRLDGRAGLLLTTDADSAPAPDWIAASRTALAGCEVATGRIVRQGRAGGSPHDRLEAYYDRLYALRRRVDAVPWDAGPHHHFTGGANMAFRSEAYLRLGGFAAVASGEDALIVDEAQRAGLRVRRDAAMVVRTSSRRAGRARGGLASQLGRGLAAEALRVSDPAGELWRYEAHALARAVFHAPTPQALAALGARLHADGERLARVAAASVNAESFATRIVPAPPHERSVSLPEAEALLAALDSAPQERAA